MWPAYPPIRGDGAAWVSWIGGVALVMLAGAAYIADEAGAVTETERIKALAWVADHMTPAFGEIRRWHRQACGGTSRGQRRQTRRANPSSRSRPNCADDECSAFIHGGTASSTGAKEEGNDNGFARFIGRVGGVSRFGHRHGAARNPIGGVCRAVQFQVRPR
jgi:hypothetical protein